MHAPLVISEGIRLHPDEVQLTAMRAQGAGGQIANKTSSAIHPRFDVGASSLPAWAKNGVLQQRDSRLGRAGVLVAHGQ